MTVLVILGIVLLYVAIEIWLGRGGRRELASREMKRLEEVRSGSPWSPEDSVSSGF